MELQVVLFERRSGYHEPFAGPIIKEGMSRFGPDLQQLAPTLVIIPTYCPIECVGMKMTADWQSFGDWRVVRKAAYVDKYILRVEVFDDPIKDPHLFKTLDEAAKSYFARR